MVRPTEHSLNLVQLGDPCPAAQVSLSCHNGFHAGHCTWPCMALQVVGGEQLLESANGWMPSLRCPAGLLLAREAEG